MQDKKHIVWFADAQGLNLENSQDRKWWLKQVLEKGRMADIRELNLDEVERVLPELYLSKAVKKLWEDYFEWKRKGTIDGTPTRCH